MIIFLYGPDSYRRQKKEKYIVSKYLEKFSGISLRRFDFEEENSPADFDSFKTFSGAVSLFEPTKVCLVKNPFKPEFQKEFKKILEKNVLDENFIILISHPSPPPKTFSFLLSKNVKSENFELLKKESWKKFVLEEAQKKEISLDDDSLKFFLENIEGDSWKLLNELEKISLLKLKADKNILAEIGLVKKYDFFFLLKTLSDSDFKKRLSAFELLSLQKEDPGHILSALAFQPGFKKIKLAKADLDIKSGRLDYNEALLSLVL